MTDPIHVEGLRDLQRAFAVADKAVSRELKVALRRAAEPVRADAERLAAGEIRRSRVDWSRMRTGVTRTLVYVAPKERGRSSRAFPARRRPNMRELLGAPMERAFARNVGEVEGRVEDALDTMAREWERV